MSRTSVEGPNVYQLFMLVVCVVLLGIVLYALLDTIRSQAGQPFDPWLGQAKITNDSAHR